MTVLLPLPLDTAGPVQSGSGSSSGSGSASATGPGRPFATAAEPEEDAPALEDVVRRVRGARRIVVICGAGVSTAAAIPDFRSARGLFAGPKGHTVKDLFHVKSLSSPALLPDHHALLTALCEKTFAAEPTPFHRLLASLDSEGRLLRCYTQNIDGLEERVGLATGVPPHRKTKRRSRAAAGADGSLSTEVSAAASVSASAIPSAAASAAASVVESAANTPSEWGTPEGTPAGSTPAAPSTSPPEHPPAPRCIPLHGVLRDMHCSLCSASVPLTSYLPLPASPIPCPECDAVATIRSALSERQRRVGTLRASVVLYGEEHPEGELIGTVVERDLKGSGRRGEREGRADLMIVAGTSLAIPGVKRIVKEMAKALSARPPASVRDGKAPPVRTVLLNAEAPAKPGEWDDIFDVWVQGDVQAFAHLVADESFAPPLPKEAGRSTPKKKAAGAESEAPPTPDETPKKTAGKKRARATAGSDAEEEADATPTKRRATKKLPTAPPTPRPTPPRPRATSKTKATPNGATKASPKKATGSAKKRVRAASPSPAGKDESSGTSTPRKRASTPTAPRSTVNAKAKKATPSKAAPSKAALKAPKRPRERDSSPSPPAKEEPNPLPELEPLETPKKKRAAQTLSPELTPKRERRASPSWPVRKREPKREREHQHPFVDIPTLAHRSEWHTSIFGNAYPHPHPHPYPHQHDHSLPYTHSLLSVPVAKAGFRGTFETVLADSARNPFVGPAQRFSPPPPVGI